MSEVRNAYSFCYMRDNRTFRALPLHTDNAIAAVLAEWDEGWTSGTLFMRYGQRPPLPVQAISG